MAQIPRSPQVRFRVDFSVLIVSRPRKRPPVNLRILENEIFGLGSNWTSQFYLLGTTMACKASSEINSAEM